MNKSKQSQRIPGAWIPTLYFMEALPYVLVNIVSVTLLTDMGLSNTEQALYTSMLYLPWVIKPLWSPLVDSFSTKRKWIWVMQMVCGISMLAIALLLPTSFWLIGSMTLFWVLAFASASHDIAADGFYILGLNSHQQSVWVGIRSTFYRIGMIFGQGLLVMLAGKLPEWVGVDHPTAWGIVFASTAAIAILLAFYHRWAIPKIETEVADKQSLGFSAAVNKTISDFGKTFKVFFTKPQIWAALLFMLLFRFPEAQLVKIAQPFMMDSFDNGGLELGVSDVGFAYGTLGVIGLLLGGILGGVAVAIGGLKKWLWPMVIAISIPDAVYILLSYTQNSNIFLVNSCVFLEQFGYGFGFTAYMMYLIYFARGENSTSVYALCTGFMALGMMLPGLFAGWLADTLGYRAFFIWILAATAVTFIVTAFLKIDPEFGKKTEKDAK